MYENFFNNINDPEELQKIIGRLKGREAALKGQLEDIQAELADRYNDFLRERYLSVQSGLLLIREQIEQAEEQLKKLE